MAARWGSAVGTTTTINSDGEEQCPICKTLRYMNRNMRFLIDPACYHPLCNNCVERLFENGPQQCPYVGCTKTLRRKNFREPTFGDLEVEREVDIRKRVAAVFNRTEDEFESLDAYNGYLEMVEDLTMDLVYGDQARHDAAEEKLQVWEDEHRAEIERNKRQGERLKEATNRRIRAEQEAARRRREEALRLEEEERMAKVRQREEDLDTLAKAPAGAAGAAARIMLKKRGQHRKEEMAASEAAALRRAAAAASGGLSIRGLKKKPGAGAGAGPAGVGAAAGDVDMETGPYDAFGKLDLRPSRYVLQADYKNDFLADARVRPSHTAGGYSLPEYYARAMFEAFAGLAVFVGDEKETGRLGVDFRELATVEAAMAAHDGDGDVKMDMDGGGARGSVKGEKDVGDFGLVKKEVPVKMEVDDF